MPKSPGQLAYESWIAKEPRNVFDGEPKKPWDALQGWQRSYWEYRAKEETEEVG